MAASSRSGREGAPDDPPERPARVGAYESCPGRIVFIEEGNQDAWISADCAVDPWP